MLDIENIKDISLNYHISFVNKLLNQVKLCEQDNENLSMFMLSVDLNKLRCMLECELRECNKNDNTNSIR